MLANQCQQSLNYLRAVREDAKQGIFPRERRYSTVRRTGRKNEPRSGGRTEPHSSSSVIVPEMLASETLFEGGTPALWTSMDWPLSSPAPDAVSRNSSMGRSRWEVHQYSSCEND